MAFGKLVDMAITAIERTKDMFGYSSVGAPDQPVYPWGLSISLCDAELEKLGLDAECDVGDLLDARCMMRVTSVSQNETTDGKRCRIELQIIMMGVEDEEHEAEEQPKRKFRPLPYKT